MQTTEKRIAALEQANPSPIGVYTIIIRRFVTPGHLDDEIHRLRSGDGEVWERLPGETEEQLIDRAKLSVKRSAGKVAMLVMAD